MNRIFILLVVCFVIQGTSGDVKSKRQECRDLAGDRSNCQRFVRCFHNLRVLFTCASGTAYVPELKTCVAKNLVTNCNDSKDRVEITISTNTTQTDDDYPTIEADANALEAPSQKDISTKESAANTPKQFGCSSYCQNQGVCVIVSQAVTCRCPSGYTGVQCQVTPVILIQPPNQCQPSPCQNGGTCYLRGGTFGCSCPVGFSGVCCEINLAATNPCYNNPCQNGGTCQIAALNLFRCVCPAGFNGLRCELRVCDPNPCLYGGVCIVIGNTFQCQCPPQYTGRTCELLIVTEPPNPCFSQPCLNGGTCTRTGPLSFVCSCTPSYYGRCCEIRNYCLPNPCYNGGSCVATSTGYICQCSFPFTGSNCETLITTPAPRPVCACVICPCPAPVVTIVNPCLPNPCQNNGGCAVLQNIARCYCPTSFTGYYCQFARKRAMNNAPCANVTCMNGGECYVNENGPQCTCPKPYYGEKCELINRPRTCNPSSCGKNGECISTKDGYKCLCKNDTTGVLCEQKVMPKNYRWCPLDCQLGTNCMYEGNTPKCRAL
jgi:Notch-like protein